MPKATAKKPGLAALAASVPKARPLKEYKPALVIEVKNKMQRGYIYHLEEYPGRNMHPDFKPRLCPGQMLAAGVFEGKYLNDQILEYPRQWYEAALKAAKLSPDKADPELNRHGLKSRQPLAVWRARGWLMGDDPRGWFEWYCRYWLGRRQPEVDLRQINRWKAFARHAAQVRKNCRPGDLACRPRQRQALLQWAWDDLI